MARSTVRIVSTLILLTGVCLSVADAAKTKNSVKVIITGKNQYRFYVDDDSSTEGSVDIRSKNDSGPVLESLNNKSDSHNEEFLAAGTYWFVMDDDCKVKFDISAKDPKGKPVNYGNVTMSQKAGVASVVMGKQCPAGKIVPSMRSGLTVKSNAEDVLTFKD